MSMTITLRPRVNYDAAQTEIETEPEPGTLPKIEPEPELDPVEPEPFIEPLTRPERRQEECPPPDPGKKYEICRQ